MKEVILTAQIKFFEAAKRSFNFPLTNSIRTSFWLKGAKISTFSELKFPHPIEIGDIYLVKIQLVERTFMKNQLKKGAEFNVGTFPDKLGSGKIKEIEWV